MERCAQATPRGAEPEQQPVFTWSSPFFSRGIVPCEIVAVKHTHGLMEQLAVAAMPPQGEALPVHDAAHGAFMTLAAHTSSREHEV